MPASGECVSIVKLIVYADASGFDALKEEWNALLKRSITNVVFLTWEWQHTWWETYQAGDLWLVACYDDADRLIGIAPWFIQNRDGERYVRTVGCVDVTDYVDVIVDRDHVEACLTALAEHLFAHTDRYDRINLCNIPEGSPTYQQLPARLREHGFTADMVLQEVCPIIRLPTSWESYLEALDKKQRHEIRRKLRRAESEAQITCYVVDETHDFEVEVDQFLRLMAASQPAKAEFLADARNAAFFRSILRQSFACGWLRLSILKVDGIATAAYCDFDYNDQIQVYNSGLLLDYCAHLSPGIILLCYNIQHAIDTQHALFDFLRGNEAYKYRMGAEDTRIYKLVARPANAAVEKLDMPVDQAIG